MNKMNKKGKIIGLSLVAIMVVSLFAAVVPSITAQAEPDLVITNADIVGNEIHYTIQNIGAAAAPRSFTGLYIDGVYRASDMVGPLAPGDESNEVFARYTYRGGVVVVCADYANLIPESNEDNNCNPPGPAPPPPPPPPEKPDLVVEDKWEEFVDGMVIVHFVIHNDGTVEAPSSHATKYLYIDDELVETHHVPVPALGVSGRFFGEFEPEPCPPGVDITVTVCADNFHVVDESDEDNNCMTNEFTCPEGPQPGGPDLVIEKTVEKQIRGCGRCQYRVDYKVTNIGNEVAGKNRIALLIDGELEDTDRCRALGPGASDEDSWEWENCPCGETFNVTVCADYYNVVDEGNEDNNCELNIVHCGVGEIEVDKKVRLWWQFDENIENVLWWFGDDASGTEDSQLDDVIDGWLQFDDDGQPDWDDTINAEQCDIVEFKCTVENTGCCCDLTDITVTDVLSPSLRYLDAIPEPTEVIHNEDGSTELRWLIPGPLPRCDGLEFRFIAEVIGCGVDTNTQTAVATTCTGEVVSDSDIATVNAPPEAEIRVIKKVWNATSEEWVDNIDVLPDTDVEFLCLVFNSGTCCNLTHIEVWDELSDSFQAIDAMGPQPPFGPQPPIVYGGQDDSTILYWSIPGPLGHCWPPLIFFIDATAVGEDEVDTNTQRARAWSARLEEWVYDEDHATVTIIPAP
jgi:hypothetical protein